MTAPTHRDYEQFLRQWGAKIDRWVRKTLAKYGGGSSADFEDLRQAAQLAAWRGYEEWRARPEHERNEAMLGAIVGREVKDAIFFEVNRVLQLPRRGQRGSGLRAALLRGQLETLVSKSRQGDARARADAMSRLLVEYHLLTVGVAHGQLGLVDADETLRRDEFRHRLVYALERITDLERAMIEGVFFEDRTLADVGAALGVHGRSAQWRLKNRAIDNLRKFMDEYASGLGSVGGTLDDEPIGGGPVA